MFYLFLFIIMAFGYLAAGILLGKVGFWEKLSLGYGLGLGIFYFLLFLLGLAGFSFTAINLLLLAFLCLAITAFISRFSPGKENQSASVKIKITKWEWFLSTALIFLVVWVFLVSLYWPIHDWDALTLYDFRARILNNETNLNSSVRVFMASGDQYYFAYSYILSFFSSFSYILRGPNPQSISFLFFVFFLLTFLIFSLKKSNIQWSLLGVLLLTTFPLLLERATTIFPNLIYLYYFTAACFLAERFYQKGRNGDFITMGLFLGFANLVRDKEPFYLALFIPLAVVCFFKKKLKLFSFGLAIFLLMAFSWPVYRSLLFPAQGVTSFYEPLRFSFTRALEVLNYLIRTLTPDYALFLIFAVISLVLSFKSLRREVFFSLIWLMTLLLFFLGTYYFSFRYKFWNDIDDSLKRTALFIVPLSVYLVISLLGKKQKAKT